MSAQTLGIDVSARWFDVARDAEVRRFPTNAEGIAACLAWMSQLGAPFFAAHHRSRSPPPERTAASPVPRDPTGRRVKGAPAASANP